MRHFIRAVLALSAGALALAFSSSALAAMNPRLDIGTSTQKGASMLSVEARLGQSDDWLGRLQVYVPTGYSLKLPAGGATVGTVSGQALATAIGADQIIKMTGTIKAIGTADPALASWASCDSSSTHVDAWMVTMSGGDDNWSFPIYVDSTTGTEAQFGANKLVACTGTREVGGSNPMGNKFMTMSMAISGITAPTKAANYTWHSLWTPFAGATGSTLDQAATVEAQSTVHIANSLLTISAKKVGKHVVLSGKLIIGGEPMDNVRVQIKHGLTKTKLVSIGSFTTSSTGSFKATSALKHSSYFQAGATTGKVDLGAAGCTAAFGFPCLDATIGGTGVVSRLIYVR